MKTKLTAIIQRARDSFWLMPNANPRDIERLYTEGRNACDEALALLADEPTKNRLRLFVWTGFARDYSPGLAFAIARDETEARKLVIKSLNNIDPHDWGTLIIRPLGRRTAWAVWGGG